MKKKGLALLLALTLVVVGVASGTLAWLTAQSGPVVNTFTTSGIEVELKETTTDYKMIPGYTIAKDPKATVKDGSEECYLFVKLEKANGFDDYMTYEMADGWTALTDVDGVYYRVVKTADIGTTYSVLKNDQVTVSGDVTSAMMTAAANAQPKLTVTAYAFQLHMNASEDFTPEVAWNNIANK